MRDNHASGELDVRLTQAAPFALNVAFTAAAGEILALVGPSGSGKTTTLRAIAGLVTPDRGRIAIGGDVWFESDSGIVLAPEQRRTGFVFQDYALFPHLNARDTVALAMGHIEKGNRAGAAMAELARVGIAHLADRKPIGLSGGERQRVALARALARAPRVLLLDEPFSAIDRPARETLKALVRTLASAAGIPVVLVTHDIDEALALASNLVIIESGATIASGTASELFRAADPRIAAIIGTQK
jgi:molybdate transport system ATP-binding protein